MKYLINQIKIKSFRLNFVILFLATLFSVNSLIAQIYDGSMELTHCYTGAYYLFAGRYPRNFIPNGNFNAGSNCALTTSQDLYKADWNKHTWINMTPTGRFPYGIPSIDQYNFFVNHLWDYSMKWYGVARIVGVPRIRTGFLYTDLYAVKNSGEIVRNYILIELVKPLQVGKEYKFEADFDTYNSLYSIVSPDSINLQIDRIGFALTDSIPEHMKNQPLILTPFYETPKDSIISLANHSVNMTITGNGQRYLIVGNFHPNDSVSFNANPVLNSHATYAFDNFKLYDPACENFGNVFIDGPFSACKNDSVSVYCSSWGGGPHQWTINGEILPDTTSSIKVPNFDDTTKIFVQIGQGQCISRDSALIIPKHYAIQPIVDTMLFCNQPIDISTVITPLGAPNPINSYDWRKESNMNIPLNSTANYTISDTGTYIFKIGYDNNTCYLSDTFVVSPNTEIAYDSLIKNIGNEHCVNMKDGYINFDVTHYPTNVHFYWDDEMISSDEVFNDSLGQGIYRYYVYDDYKRCSFFTDTIQLTYDSCSVIRGKIFSDVNDDCTYQIAENGISNIMVYTAPLNNFGITDSLGNFEIYVPSGTYNLMQNLANNHSIDSDCDIPVVTIDNNASVVDSIFIGDKILSYPYDPAIGGIIMSIIPLNEGSISCFLNIYNNGDSTTDIKVGLKLNHPVISNDTSKFEFIALQGDTSYYLFQNIEGHSSFLTEFRFTINPDVSYIGQLAGLHFFCEPMVEDADTSNNTTLESRLIVAAYDPNIKVVSPSGEYLTNKTPIAERDFTYTIHFQNTGNYPARDVLIKDSISDLLDLKTFQLLKASHPVSVGAYNNVVSFLFKNIYLPDSTANEKESKGFVQFRITSTPDAYANDEIINRGYIYFDNNPPIITPDVANLYYKPVYLIDTVATACLGDSIYFNGSYYKQTGIYSDTISTYYLDTVYYADVNIVSPHYVTIDSLICYGDAVYFSGEYLNVPGNYVDYLTDIHGCDSIVSLHLNVNNSINAQVVRSSANEFEIINNSGSNYQYQWIDCNTNKALDEETNALFRAKKTGNYAVIISDGACESISSCFSVEDVSLLIRPNPTEGIVFIPAGVEIEIFSVTGHKMVVEVVNYNNLWSLVDISAFSNGVYLFKIGNEVRYVIKQ